MPSPTLLSPSTTAPVSQQTSSSSPPPPSQTYSEWRHKAPRAPGHVDLDYRSKLILAPMVRVGTLPMRLLSLEHGADIVFSPETIDRRLIRSKRVQNDLIGCIDYVDQDDGTLNLRVHPSEKPNLIIQIGSSDPANAVKAALAVSQDAAGIDLNCGCPKRFSIVSAMGAALLSEPDRLCAILTALVQNVPLPITAKIRMLETTEQTVELVRRIEKTGVSAITLHCRLRSERPTNPGHWSIFKPIADALTIPLIANGDVFCLEDTKRLQEISGISSFMLARAPQSNFSVFNPKGMITVLTAVKDYARKAIQYDMPFHNCKYTLMQMWPEAYKETTHSIHALGKTKSYKGLCELLELGTLYDDTVSERLARARKDNLMHFLRLDVEGELGPDCPYLPSAPYLPRVVRDTKPKAAAEEVELGDLTLWE